MTIQIPLCALKNARRELLIHFLYQIMEMYLTEFEKIIANAIFLTNSLNADYMQIGCMRSANEKGVI